MGGIAERLRNRITCLEAALADTEGRNARLEHELQQARAAQARAGDATERLLGPQNADTWRTPAGTSGR